jgi:hypothetical protein
VGPIGPYGTSHELPAIGRTMSQPRSPQGCLLIEFVLQYLKKWPAKPSIGEKNEKCRRISPSRPLTDLMLTLHTISGHPPLRPASATILIQTPSLLVAGRRVVSWDIDPLSEQPHGPLHIRTELFARGGRVPAEMKSASARDECYPGRQHRSEFEETVAVTKPVDCRGKWS